MITILIIATFAYIISKISTIQIKTHTIDELIKDTHKYSGINEESYGLFYANIQLAREYLKQIHQSHAFLHKAIHHLNEIPLYMQIIEPDIQGEVAILGQKIAIAFERLLIEEAMNQNTYFKAKYI